MAASSSSLTVDLNSDMGEGYGAYAMGRDAEILGIVTSANVACGFHAGDPEIMAATFSLARENRVAVGAHPGFPDLWGFGRRPMPFSASEIERLVAYQIGAAQALAAYAGHRLSYVKAHGALGNLTQTDASVARAVTRAIRAVDPTLICLTIALGEQTFIAREMGLTVKSEIFADRAYGDQGQLVSRQIEGAVIHDADQAAQRIQRMIEQGAIETISGRSLATQIDSICVHSDTPGAVAIARRVRETLEEAGVRIRSFAD
ncbi:LamB/YcsF family protein [Taklimakanibacter deserti]|uniref:LamB/YcsF family protein n=1 Tax=Taklimakanibacter deserti TaxID=2267839 RepID=UPI000E64742A